ncbi:MAG: RNA methyltransferase [Anaerolineaceae bacterium]|nr:RNA methyltransferase [Anaerolineaceae bacterium]
MITSRKNPKIQQLRALLAKKSLRQQSSQCVLEGVRLLEEALDAKWQPLFGFHSTPLDQRSQAVLQHLSQCAAEMEEVPKDLLQYMADTQNPQGIIAVFEQKPLPIPDSPTFVLILDALRDPGNLGTILRSAAAAGVDLVLLSDDCADPYSPKVLRSGMGAQFRLPLSTHPIPDILSFCQKHTLALFIADSNTGNSCWQEKYDRPLALVIGNEANGPSPTFHTAYAKSINIPMPGNFESLNAAVASGILMFEIVKQRQQ